MKTFSLEEALTLLPRVRESLLAAREEIQGLCREVRDANDLLLKREWALREARIGGHGEPKVAELQLDWDDAAADLMAFKEHLSDRHKSWLAGFEDLGVVVRDLDRGLVDFPGIQDDLELYFCWELCEPSILCWHGRDEGYEGRKSVDVLRTRAQ